MLKYKIALSMIRGVGLLTYKKLISVFGDDESVFKASRKALSSVSGVGESIWEQIAAKKVLEWAEEELEFLYKTGGYVIAMDDDKFPYRLKECNDHPILMYAKGEICMGDRDCWNP